MEGKMTAKFLIPVFLIIMAYEWLISGFNKLTNTHDYFQDLSKQMEQSISNIQLPFYAQLMKKVGMAHPHIFGSLVMYGELFVGLIFLISAGMLFTGRMNRIIGNLGIIASLIATFMSLNYALMGGDGLWVDTGNAFQEGISVDWLLFFFEITFVFYFNSIKGKRNLQVIKDQDKIAA